MVADLDPDGDQPKDEPVMVVNTNAVVDPRTVMVEAIDTFVANRAVAAARRPDDLTLGAQIERIYVSEQVEEIAAVLALDGASIAAGG